MNGIDRAGTGRVGVGVTQKQREKELRELLLEIELGSQAMSA
jgi:hypothetical protein